MHDGDQIVLQFNTAGSLTHRYLWNPSAVDQIMADEQVSSLSSPGDVLLPLADHLGTIRRVPLACRQWRDGVGGHKGDRHQI